MADELVYHCPTCDKYLITWKTKDGGKGKCYTGCKQTWKLKELNPLPRNPDYVQKRSLKQHDSTTSIMTRERLLQLLPGMENLQIQALVCVMFLTGGRVSEIVRMRVDSDNFLPGVKKFNFIDEVIDGKKVLWVKGMRLLKTHEEHPPSRTELPISYKQDHEFIYYIKEYLKHIEPEDELFPFKARKARAMISEYVELYPHFFRSMRYFDLGKTYKWDTSKRTKYFGWKGGRTADSYDKLRSMDLLDGDIF